MKKREERIKLSLGIFCSVCILTLVYLTTNAEPGDLLTNLEKVEKNVNVSFVKDAEINQVFVEPYDVVKFENISFYGTTVNDYEVKFDNKTGKVDYTFYIENKSNNDAVLKEYKLPYPLCKGFAEDCDKVLQGIEYKIKYDDGSELRAGDVFKAKEMKKVILTIKYKANEKQIPSATTDISNLGFTLEFKAK